MRWASRSSRPSPPRRRCPRSCSGAATSATSASGFPRTWSCSTTTSESHGSWSGAASVSLPEPIPATAPGASLLAEIHEQPTALARRRELEGGSAGVAAEARRRGATTVRMVGHGSSDNAAAYGVYAFGLLPRWTALRDSITLTVHYGADLDLRGSTVIG